MTIFLLKIVFKLKKSFHRPFLRFIGRGYLFTCSISKSAPMWRKACYPPPLIREGKEGGKPLLPFNISYLRGKMPLDG